MITMVTIHYSHLIVALGAFFMQLEGGQSQFDVQLVQVDLRK